MEAVELIHEVVDVVVRADGDERVEVVWHQLVLEGWPRHARGKEGWGHLAERDDAGCEGGRGLREGDDAGHPVDVAQLAPGGPPGAAGCGTALGARRRRGQRVGGGGGEAERVGGWWGNDGGAAGRQRAVERAGGRG